MKTRRRILREMAYVTTSDRDLHAVYLKRWIVKGFSVVILGVGWHYTPIGTWRSARLLSQMSAASAAPAGAPMRMNMSRDTPKCSLAQEKKPMPALPPPPLAPRPPPPPSPTSPTSPTSNGGGVRGGRLWVLNEM